MSLEKKSLQVDFSFENRKIWREIDTHKQREKIEAGERKRARQKQRKAQTGSQNGRYSETKTHRQKHDCGKTNGQTQSRDKQAEEE